MGESIMKKFGKRILALGVALSIICSIGCASFAASSIKPTVNGIKGSASSTMAKSGESASASTTYNASGAVSVKSTYTSVHIATRKVKTQNKTKGNYGSVSVSFTKPLNHVSKRISSEHSISVGNQKWTGKTSDSYWIDN